MYGQIHDIVFYGNGGYSWSDVYNMPIWVRRFTFNKIKEYYEKKDEAEQSAVEKAKGIERVPIPNIPKASYNSKASKK